jgi:hypothetical protein
MGGIDMESEPGVLQVLDAMANPAISEVDRFRMTAIILGLATDAARQLLETKMQTGEYQKTLADRIHDEGKAEGKAGAAISLLDARGIALSPEQREQIASCTDLAQADAWFNRALTAGSADEVFAD